MAARYRLRRDEAEDLNQEVWTRVVAHLPKFEWRGDARGLRVWLYKLVARQAIDLLRKRNRLRARRTALAGDQLEAAATPPVRLWRKTWKQELVHVLLADLRKKVSPLNYQLLHLRWMEQQSLAERAALNVYQGEPFAGE